MDQDDDAWRREEAWRWYARAARRERRLVLVALMCAGMMGLVLVLVMCGVIRLKT